MLWYEPLGKGVTGRTARWGVDIAERKTMFVVFVTLPLDKGLVAKSCHCSSFVYNNDKK